MVDKLQKDKTIEFLCQQLEEAQKYQIKKKLDNQWGILFSEGRQNNVLVVANFMPTIETLLELSRKAYSRKTVFAPIFYKDGKSAFVRVVESNSSMRAEKSLKQYSSFEINQMLHLRGTEKKILEIMRNDKLFYYQPRTERLEESVRGFKMKQVILDYSHIGPEHRAYSFVETRPAIDYKLPQETFRTSSGIEVVKQQYYFKGIIAPNCADSNQKLF